MKTMNIYIHTLQEAYNRKNSRKTFSVKKWRTITRRNKKAYEEAAPNQKGLPG